MAMNAERFIEDAIAEIRRDVQGRAIIGLSGGVDSSVCAMLSHRALGDRLVPVYVDSGLMRQFESDRIELLFQDIGLVRVNAQDRFLEALKGVTDPEEKRKVVGETTWEGCRAAWSSDVWWSLCAISTRMRCAKWPELWVCPRRSARGCPILGLDWRSGSWARSPARSWRSCARPTPSWRRRS
ncbi:MAG: hypothetical protein NTV25_08845 [Methanothrix sp.]|nr:hypothetical protein [Methanothrix sp.]